MDQVRTGESGRLMEPSGGPDAPADRDAEAEPDGPGSCPFTHDGCPSADPGRPRTARQYTGSGTAVESNARYRQLIANGARELSVAFDLPTRTGRDSDAPAAHGEVGRAGVAVDSVDDMRVLFAGIPLGEVSTSMTLDAPAAVLLLLYQLVAEEQGVRADRLAGTVRNDVLTQYIVRGTSLFPPEPSLRLTADVLRYCRARLPRWNPLAVSGRPLAQAGASPAQEIAFTLAGGIEYVRTAVASGMDVDDVAPRLSFFFAPRATALQEAAGSRAARRVWARVMKEEFGARSPASQMLRLHPQAAGARPAARRPEADLVRAAAGGPAAVPGGPRSRHADSFDEAIALPAGSYAAERMTDAAEAAVLELMAKVETLGGAAAAAAHGFQRREIERSAHRLAHRLAGESGSGARADPAVERRQRERLAKLRAWRCSDRVDDALIALRKAAEGSDNVLYPMKEALACGATVGEVCGTLRGVWGTYVPADTH